MDDDVDFFDMRSRFKPSEKRKREKNIEDDSDSDSSSVSSSDDSIREYVPRKPTVTKKKAAPPSKKRRPIIALSTDEEDNSEEDPSEPVETNTDRSISLTPPPIVGEEALRQAMAVINDHMKNSTSATTTTRSRTRQQTSHSTTTSTTAVDPPPVPASDDLDDDFDLAAYQNSMNSDIAKQAAILYSRQEEKPAVESKIFLVLVGKRFDGETLPLEWSKPLGLKFSTTMQFTKLRDEFKKQRKYEKEVILVLKGMRLSYGSAKELGLKDQTLIDVFSEYGYKVFLERQQEKAKMKKTGAIELSSEEEEEPPPQPEMVTLHLQGPLGKYRFRLPNTSTIRKVEAAYRRQCSVPPEKQITIELDGDVLPDDKTIAEMDLEGDELLDVVIKGT